MSGILDRREEEMQRTRRHIRKSARMLHFVHKYLKAPVTHSSSPPWKPSRPCIPGAVYVQKPMQKPPTGPSTRNEQRNVHLYVWVPALLLRPNWEVIKLGQNTMYGTARTNHKKHKESKKGFEPNKENETICETAKHMSLSWGCYIHARLLQRVCLLAVH